MDQRCQERAEIIEQWILTLDRAEEILFNLEASEDAVYGEIFLKQDGSNDIRKAKANADPQMRELRQNIASAKRAVLKAKRMYDLALKAGDWEYGTFKTEENIVRRQRGA